MTALATIFASIPTSDNLDGGINSFEELLKRRDFGMARFALDPRRNEQESVMVGIGCNN